VQERPPISPEWYPALSLAERAQLLRGSALLQAAEPTDAGRAAADRWIAQRPFGHPERLAARIRSEALTEESWLRLLSVRADRFASALDDPPEWMQRLEADLSAWNGATALPPAGEETRAYVGFLQVAAPFLSSACARLQAFAERAVAACPGAPFHPLEIVGQLLEHVPQLVFMRVSRTMVLELNVARLQGRLEGETADERFSSFGRVLAQPETVRAIHAEYPVLARSLCEAVSDWETVGQEFVERLAGDWESIRRELFEGADPGRLTHLRFGAGDTHRRGRTVGIATFEHGARLVYKPHSLAIDETFNRLLEWLNARCDLPDFRTTAVLDRRSYGWMAFVPAAPCETREALSRFYIRQGGLLALLYALEATDFHLENLIASGEHPVLVDLEALFHPRMPLESDAVLKGTSTGLLGHSVLRVGLLPARSWALGGDSVDISAMGGRAGQMTPAPILTYDGAGTDEMRVVRRRVEMPGSENRPVLEGMEADPLEFTEEIVRGFTTVFECLRAHREALTRSGGVLDEFRDDEIRAVLRPTRVYGRILLESYHPDLMRDALDRDLLLDRLWAAARGSSLDRVSAFEHADLVHGDVPVFTTCPGSADVWSSTGERVEAFFAEPGLEVARRRITRMDEADLARQVWFIRASMTSLVTGVREQGAPTGPVPQAGPEASAAELIAAARAVGDRLEALALREDSRAGWVGVSPIGDQNWAVQGLAGDLYAGQPGVALFLAYLGEVTGEERYTVLAGEAIRTLREHVALPKSESEVLGSVGAHTGWSGIAYVFAHLSVLWSDPELSSGALQIADTVAEMVEHDRSLDFIQGVAGCICALESVYAVEQDPCVLQTIRECADHLLRCAEPQEEGMAWRTNHGATQPLTGFSHGATGIAYALGRAAALTGVAEYGAMALEALKYEQSVFLHGIRNWPDFRDLEDPVLNATPLEQRTMTTWCHGAPGAGLARVHLMELLGADELRPEIETAVETTLIHGFGASHSICHGDLGNVELLVHAGRALGRPEWSRLAYRIAASVLDQAQARGWACGIPTGLETPGLMTGLAGIGYQLLHLADPESVPSILTLAQPASAAIARVREMAAA
jgi:type 2 lantibiotic biosynthesis protein LanM